MRIVRTISMLLLLCALTISSKAQSPTQNYVMSKEVLDVGGTHAITTVTYYDGLGNPVETATNGLGGTGKYAYTLLEHDALGREKQSWLPGTAQSGCSFVSPSKLSSSLIAFHNDQNPYSLNRYDVLDRQISTLGAGESWHKAKKSVNQRYSSNESNSVKLYQVSESGALVEYGYYAANSLSMLEETDEDGKTKQTFSDLFGNKVLERRDGNNDTYYIYDNIGRLRYVLSPSYQEYSDLQKFGYEYRYDKYGRCVWKRLPGCEYQQMWYDAADNLMFSQDGEQRKKGLFVFYLYDKMKREVLMGTTTSMNALCTSALATYGEQFSGLCNSGYTPLGNLGLGNEQLLSAKYYDCHSFLNRQMVKNLTSKSLSAKTSGLQESYNIGSQTGIVTRNTDGDLLASVSYHDLRGLVVESMQIKPDEVFLRQSIKYSFTRKPIEVKAELTKGDMTKNVTQLYVYNPNNDKIETMTIQVGNVTRTVASYSYDDIGRLVSVNRSGNAGSVHYAYNIRNWLKETKSDRFKQNLYYESTKENPCFNGNISRMQWQSSKDNVLRGYDFIYDGLNRLEESAYGEGADLSQSKSHYSEHVLSYSPNGSIERLQRYGKKNNGTFGLIDDLTYAYNGNQIKSISDKAGSLLYDGSFDFKDGADADVEYFYDANGALVKDLNKGISNIEYDVLGNLKCITFNNGFKTKYVYDAAGNKLRTTHESVVTNTTDYIGNFIFEDGKLDKYLFDGGYCSFDNNQNPTFHYYEKDHLASVRMVVNENGTIEQVNHYYPFGGVYGDLSYNAEIQKSKYIGKEFDHMHGLDLYDHGARMYDAARVVWDRVDKFCEKTPNLGVFLYCQNNPIIKFDPNGKEIIDLLSSSKENEPLKDDISKFTDEANVINIWAHGNSDGFYSLGITDAKSFNIMLNQNSKVWKKHSDNKQVVIVLHSCKTADFARKLSESELFKDVLIIAPNKNVQVRYEKNKLKRISTGVSDYEGKNVRTLKKSTGYWMGYKNGEFYNKYSGDFKTPNQNSEKPGAKGFDYDTWWQIIYKFFQQMINKM